MATAELERPRVATSTYLTDVDPATWKWGPYLRRYSKSELKRPERRRLLTRYDPLLFAVLYLRHHLASEETRSKISINQFHIDACREARTWCRRDLEPTEARDAWVAPRGSGKSTWFFLILSLWALAHEHRKFIAAFADSGPQAEQHLLSFKREIDNNALLRTDYPDLVRPSTRPSGVNVSDMKSLYVAASGVAFLAKGIDSSTLGAKVGNQRPDTILFDDIEPDESNYSLYQKEKRLGTVRNAVLPMNLNAVVIFVGTTTMQGAIMHDIVRSAEEAEPPEWVAEEKVRVHYYNAIVTNADGTERSLWPQRWTMKFLDSIRDTVSFALNFANRPVSLGGWWKRSHIRYGALKHYDRVAMIVDGAVTTTAGSDFTGIAIAGLSVKARRIFLREAVGVKLGGEELRQCAIDLIVANDVDYMMVEANQGGDLWHTVFHDMPIPVVTFTQHEPKPVRIKRLLALYQRAGSRIFHEKKLAELEKQQEGYPKILHEDVLDAAAAVCEHLVAMLFKLIGTKDKTLVHQFSYRQGR